MQEKCRDTWRKEFLPLVPPQQVPDESTSFLRDLMGLLNQDIDKDEFERYIRNDPTLE
jgi:hypothetical protein